MPPRSCPKTKPIGNNNDPQKRLKVGLVSGSFKRHPVGYMTLSALEAVNPHAMELIFYSQSGHEDDLTQRYKQRADQWHVITGLNDEGLADR